MLDPLDTILSLNYDLVCDHALKEVEKQEQVTWLTSRSWKMDALLGNYSYATGPMALFTHEEQRGFYLKLHGSLDWLICSNERCPIIILDPRGEVARHHDQSVVRRRASVQWCRRALHAEAEGQCLYLHRFKDLEEARMIIG